MHSVVSQLFTKTVLFSCCSAPCCLRVVYTHCIAIATGCGSADAAAAITTTDGVVVRLPSALAFAFAFADAISDQHQWYIRDSNRRQETHSYILYTFTNKHTNKIIYQTTSKYILVLS